MVDRQKIKIALLNIIVNAIESMTEGSGKLTLKTARKGNFNTISIGDNGIGMDKESLSKIFDPFYTGKQNGTGLGLTNSQNIIFNHKGKINVRSEIRKGTTFSIILEPAG